MRTSRQRSWNVDRRLRLGRLCGLTPRDSAPTTADLTLTSEAVQKLRDFEQEKPLGQIRNASEERTGQLILAGKTEDKSLLDQHLEERAKLHAAADKALRQRFAAEAAFIQLLNETETRQAAREQLDETNQAAHTALDLVEDQLANLDFYQAQDRARALVRAISPRAAAPGLAGEAVIRRQVLEHVHAIRDTLSQPAVI